ncbi:LacI family DNA-binding transcriptional regulator [Streptomyces radicis]|uniref:LacI family DNA-binding transcriptional regulator n=1 Tax=Streptomyces radicis TaxID=1750517 RepID=A0A3A9WWJ4_9ACTN|nr:LacI family DNA-binding transcriptional regulator [Streptomyces radicis]RKN12176.1 LacI family DNA-binding transcriptional regulator [Streptomyces radicis]RKN25771.1 LacI family DNA-binding transcriptional regulator [Streptomyces radicis]
MTDAGPARLADIAAQARVSEATVSRVLNGKAGVAAATRQKVLAALDVLGYERPTRLRQRSAGLVGLVIPELTNPIFPAFAQVIEQLLAGRGYTPVLCTRSPGGATEDELVEQLVDRGVTGIIFLSGMHADTTADPARYARLTGRGVPFVLINGFQPAISAPSVSPDDAAATRIAVRHLRALGHRRIGLAVGPDRFVPVRRKVAGFLEEIGGREAEIGGREAEFTVEGAGIAEGGEGVVRHSLFGVEGGQAAATALLDAGCTGIVCGSDMTALGAIRAVRQRGLDVPRDVSVVGYDDSYIFAFTDPPLTTLRQPVRAMAAAAVDALLEEVGGTLAHPTEFVFQCELVVRGSTAQARAAAAPPSPPTSR